MMSWVCGEDGGAAADSEWTGGVAAGWWKKMKLTEIRHNCLFILLGILFLFFHFEWEIFFTVFLIAVWWMMAIYQFM